MHAIRKIKYLQILEVNTLKSLHADSVPAMIFGRESRGRTCCKLQMQVCGIVHRNAKCGQYLRYYQQMADSRVWKARMQTAYWWWYFSQWNLTIDLPYNEWRQIWWVQIILYHVWITSYSEYHLVCCFLPSNPSNAHIHPSHVWACSLDAQLTYQPRLLLRWVTRLEWWSHNWRSQGARRAPKTKTGPTERAP